MEQSERDQTAECRCFGDLGIHASTYAANDDSGTRLCDFCGMPVPEDSADALTAINRPDMS